MKNKFTTIMLLLSFMIVATGVLVMSRVNAQTYTTPAPAVTTSTITATPNVTAGIPPVEIDIDSNGSTLIRGTVQSVGTNSVVINSWIGPWTIQTSSATTMIPVGTSNGDTSNIAVGDFVGALGTVNQNQSLTVVATVVHDWTKTNPGISTATTSTLPTGQNLYTGTVSSIGQNTFVLSGSDGNSYTVNVDSNTAIWNTARSVVSFGSINSGDSIRIDGTLSGSTITASVVRDTSQ
jgi:hypothetical protein